MKLTDPRKELLPTDFDSAIKQLVESHEFINALEARLVPGPCGKPGHLNEHLKLVDIFYGIGECWPVTLSTAYICTLCADESRREEELQYALLPVRNNLLGLSMDDPK